MRTHPAHRAVASCVVVLLLLTAAPAGASAAYVLPLDGTVLRRFEPGPSPYGPGHRGVDLAAAPGTTVRAAGAGTVAFTGVVVGLRWVSIDHPDGVRTSYGPLASSSVRRGDQVARDAAIGTTAASHDGRPALHWSARRGGTYVDPLSLLRAAPWRPALVGAGAWRVTDLPDLPSYGAWDGQHRWGLVPDSPAARGVGWLLPPNPNHVVVIAGFGSTSGTFPIDLRDLGYDPSQITELSHAGRDPWARPDPDDPRRDQRPYDGDDTLVGIQRLAEQLRDQLRAHARTHPGQAVDLVGHSMGGVVAMHYLLTMHDPTDPALPPIGHVATFASPLEGASLANLGDGVAGALVGEAVLRLTGRHDEVTGVTTRDLAVGSALLRDLSAAWDEALAATYAGPLATGTQVLTVGASRDGVVPEHRTDLPDAAHVVLPGGHSSALDTEAARIVLRAFLSGSPPPGEDGGVGHWVSYPVSGIERAAGYLAPWVGPSPVSQVGRVIWRLLPLP